MRPRETGGRFCVVGFQTVLRLSGGAIAARRLYADPKWKAASLVHLRSNPVCKDCDEPGVVEAATDVDHVTPHKGDRKLFWDRSNRQSLCL